MKNYFLIYDDLQSDTVFAKEDIETYTDKILRDQLMQLENICNRVRDILLVSQHHELLSRCFI